MLNKFLLVDDDQDDRDLFSEALRNIDSSMELQTAQNGIDVLEKLRNRSMNPQIIFLDINMPVMNGWECLTHLKADADLKAIPVVMYSTSPAAIDGSKALSSGAVCFLEKPPTFVKLRDFLQRLATAEVSDLTQQLRTIAMSKDHRMVVA